MNLPLNGKPRKLVLHANRNGFFYVLDRVTGEYLRATKLVDKLDWATGIDAKGRPILVPDKDPMPNGNRACPRVRGAYAVDGKQCVAIASATAIFSFGLFEPVRSVPLPKIRVE